MKNNIIVATIIIIVVGVGSFFAGMHYQASQRSSFTQFDGSGGFNRTAQRVQFGRANAQSGRPVTGEIISTDDKSITIKMLDGSRKIVILSDKTSINKAAEGTKADLKTGIRVAAFGAENSDSSITAQNIQLNPIFRGMLGTQSPAKK